ncbi:hypothetical protein BMS3Bbin13_00013 [bacterium BMS3Bbin13]|nr:hypothetical protein BMS3Bbin13_00013 [bacterium BMS3Bbin13]
MNAYERLLQFYAPTFVPQGLGEDQGESRGEERLRTHNARYGAMNAIMIAVFMILKNSAPPLMGLAFTLLMLPHAIFLGFALRGFVSSLIHPRTEN